MKKISITDQKLSLEQILEAASKETVLLSKHQVPRFIVMNIEEYSAKTNHNDSRRSYTIDELPEDLAAELYNRLSIDLMK